jgi:hypothetical protein
MMRAGAFVRRNGAFGLGHVGWAFQYTDGSYCDGSVENPAGTPVSPPGQTGFWTQRVVDPDVPMQLRAYDEFKLFEVESVAPDRADKTVAWVGQQPYLVIFRNCMDDTYDVLRSYGVPDLPLPFLEITPNNWFDQLSPASQPVTPQALRAAGLIPAARVASARRTTRVKAEPPAWRTAGTPEWLALNQELLKPTLEKRLAHPSQPPDAPAKQG